VRKQVDPKRIERLEAFARSLQIEDARKRHLESLAKMSDEEVASMIFALRQIDKVEEEDPWRGEALFRSGSAAMERLEERARLGWRRYCETGGHAAVVDYCEATDGESSLSGTPCLDRRGIEVLFEGEKPGKERCKGVRFHLDRLAGESEK
jgi:hypothetical protein